jgi:hypothetical protein
MKGDRKVIFIPNLFLNLQLFTNHQDIDLVTCAGQSATERPSNDQNNNRYSEILPRPHLRGGEASAYYENGRSILTINVGHLTALHDTLQCRHCV